MNQQSKNYIEFDREKLGTRSYIYTCKEESCVNPLLETECERKRHNHDIVRLRKIIEILTKELIKDPEECELEFANTEDRFCKHCAAVYSKYDNDRQPDFCPECDNDEIKREFNYVKDQTYLKCPECKEYLKHLNYNVEGIRDCDMCSHPINTPYSLQCTCQNTDDVTSESFDLCMNCFVLTVNSLRDKDPYTEYMDDNYSGPSFHWWVPIDNGVGPPYKCDVDHYCFRKIDPWKNKD